MKRTHVFMALCSAITATSKATAQYTASECSTIKANATANPARPDTLAIVSLCSGYGPVYATLIGRYSLASDTSTYGQVFDHATALRNPDVFTAAKTVAADASAPAFARVGALILLTNYGSKAGTFLARTTAMTNGGAPFICSPPEMSGYLGVSSDPNAAMPSDYIAQSLTLSRTVLSDVSAPKAVRFAASCLHTITLGDSIPSPSTYNPTFNPAHDFQLHSACSSTYLFRNLTPITVAVYITDTHTNVSRWISLPPRPSGATYSEETMKATHGISVSYQGAVIATANPNTSC